MTRTRLRLAAATAQIHVVPRFRQALVQDSPARPRTATPTVSDRRSQTNRAKKSTDTRRRVQTGARLRHNDMNMSKYNTTRMIISRGRRSSSGGGGVSDMSSDSHSGKGHRVGKNTYASAPQALVSLSQSSSKQFRKKCDSKNDTCRSSTSLVSKHKNPGPKIVISDSFTEICLPYDTRGIRIVIEEDYSLSSSPRCVQAQGVQSQRQPERQSSASIKAGRAFQIHRSLPQLSPRSLRKARLRALDKMKKDSSSSSASLRSGLGFDRHGSALLPRQHYCEPSIHAHYDALCPQRSGSRQHARREGSPDPGSPPGNGSISPKQEKRKVLHKAHYRIANMGVADILRAVTDQSSSLRLIPTSTVHELNLDDATRSQFTEIMKPRHGTSVTGSGPWSRIETCRNRLDWDRWCHLHKVSEDEKDDEVLFTCDNQIRFIEHEIDERLLRDHVVLVPLTSSQTALLREQLQALDKEDYQ